MKSDTRNAIYNVTKNIYKYTAKMDRLSHGSHFP